MGEGAREICKIRKIVIYGCGGHARSIVNTVRELGEDVEIVLVDENAQRGEIILDCRVEREYELNEKDGYIVAVGNNRKRAELYKILQENNKGRCLSVVSEHACIGIDVQIEQGTFVAPNAYIGPQASVGADTIINTGSIIEHEVQIGSHTHIAPHTTVCGRARIGNNVFCGAGSVIIDNIEICDDVMIGAGAVVKKNIMEAGTYVGVPVKKIR